VHVAARRAGYQLGPYERIKLIELKSIGWSYRQIHERYPDIPIATIKTTWLRRSQKGPTQETLARSGPPKKLTQYDKTQLLEGIDQNPRIKYDDLLATVNYKVKRQAIWRLLREENRRKWLIFRRPELTEDHARAHRDWAERVQGYTSNQWKKIFWSDKSTVERGKGAQREYTFTRPADQIKARDIDAISVHKGIK
jgi:transposase